MDAVARRLLRSPTMAGAQLQREMHPLPSVLVVDDEPGMVETLSDVLEAHGYEVHTAGSGEAAVAAIASAKGRGALPVVLMDIKMPGMDGVQAMHRMRALVPDVRVVLMTAYTSEAVALAASRGAAAVLQKPLDLDKTLPLLRAIAGGR